MMHGYFVCALQVGFVAPSVYMWARENNIPSDVTF